MSGSDPEVIPITSASILHTLPGRYYLSWIDEHGVAQRQKAILCEHGANDTMHVRTADEHWSIRSDSQWIPLYTLVGKASLERLRLVPLADGASRGYVDGRRTKFGTAKLESLEWFAAADTQPDEGMLVLVHCPEASEPVWVGSLDAREWHWPDGNPIEHDVHHWAELPRGPAIAAPVSGLSAAVGAEVQHG